MSDLLRVTCLLKNCAFYKPVPRDPSLCDCSHKDKGHYLNNRSCPLFRPGWNPEADTALAARFFGKRR
ncbi:MAG: hypothetical protein NTW86_13855 [Candidatus Sumerlaeota bacterium]|nr:hypothetical protein [Candidatus Sumerlaeota bacterium]